MFDKFINRYIIEGKLTAVTALHIGAAENVFRPNGCKNPFFRNANDMPLIPGSSLKGAMRSFLEQYFSSGLGKRIFSEKQTIYLEHICNEENPCANPKKNKELEKILKEKKEDPEKNLANYLFGEEGKMGKLCMICRLFGSQYSAAKFSVRDAGVISESFEGKFEIRSGVTIDRDLGTSVDGKKFEVEVVPKETAFSFHAILENGDEMEWEVIQWLLRAMKMGLIPIGGMKSRGLGEIKLENIRYQMIDQNNIENYLCGGQISFQEFDKEKETKEVNKICSEN